MKSLRLFLCFCLMAGVAGPVWARATFAPLGDVFAPTTLPDEEVISDDKPTVLSADRVDYVQQQDIVIATGKVEVAQGDTLVLCDELTYDRAKDVVRARGNVSVMDKVGNVMFADEVELRDQLRSGVIEQFKLRFSDDSLFAAARATRVNEHVLELEKAVYSPCKVKCNQDLEPGESPYHPLWQVRAKHVTIDDEEQIITYDNAWMEVYGLPVFYTPYLSHATPNADGKAGFMVPEFERNKNLGSVYRLPFYYPIAGDKDIIVTPIQTSQEGPLLRTSYRQRFDQGQMTVDASGTHPRDRDAAGNLISGRQWRGHFYTTGQFKVDEDNNWGFDVKKTSDDTYLRKYEIDGQTLLISRVYGESFTPLDWSQRNALSAEAIEFQGLSSVDDSRRIPLVLPLVNFDFESDPGAYGSRTFFNSNALMLTRDLGAQSRRLSNTLGWRLPYITEGGQRIEFSTQLRGDIYDNSDVLLGNGQNFNGVTGRLVPEISTLWSLPFINQLEEGSIILEPVASVAVSPNGGNPEKISNEDSLVPEFTDTNLFSENRFAGYDRIEHGPRASYGLRGAANYRNTYVDWLVGQHYRMQADRNFPFSNDIDDHLSDYVGKVGIQYNPFYLSYRFRLDKEGLTSRRREVDANYLGSRLQARLSYIRLQNDPVLASREEVASDARVNVSKHWTAGVLLRNDLEIKQITSIGGTLVYTNECISVESMVDREYTRDREIEPSTKYLIRLSLKNLN